MMGRFFYVLIQCTWGALQTMAGALVFLRYRRQPHFFFHGAAATIYPLASSLSLGMFVFLSDHPPGDRRGLIPAPEIPRRLLVHEYGHTIQSLLLGPLYLPLVGLPSVLWAQLPPCQKKWRGDVSYFSFATERTANFLGELTLKEPSMGSSLI